MSQKDRYLDGGREVLLESLITGDTSQAIRNQEARGQSTFVNSATLPIKSYDKRELFEQIGIEYGDNVDDMFVNVILPDGWKKEATEHSMHSKLLDEKGRERASIFYKAAFYDRSAHISLSKRFGYHVLPVCGYDDPQYRQSEYHCIVTDCGDIIWTSDVVLRPEPQDRSEFIQWMSAKDTLSDSGKVWLQEHYPDWKNPLAYWD